MAPSIKNCMKQSDIMSQVDATWCSLLGLLTSKTIGLVFMWLYYLQTSARRCCSSCFLLFFWGDIGCKGLYLSTPDGQNPHHFNLHAFVLPLSLAPANGSRFGISRMHKHSFNGQKSLIWIMDPYHSHLQPQKLHEAGGTGRLPDTGGSSR